jgi:DNA polymerase III epsilon subunit-like protein
VEYLTIGAIDQQLQQEEQARLPLSRAELEERQASRSALSEQLVTIDHQVKALTKRFHRLTKLPDFQHVQWASALLRFPNLSFVTIDTTGVQKDSDVIRIVIANVEGTPIFDRIVRPIRQPSQSNTSYTGIGYSQIKDAPTLADIWLDLQEAIAGRYVLAYNLDFLRQRLNENAHAYGLPSLNFIGECLMERASNYYHASTALKLTDVCARIGHTLHQPATALDRLGGQRALLSAMSEGVTMIHVVPLQLEEDDWNEEHPF